MMPRYLNLRVKGIFSSYFSTILGFHTSASVATFSSTLWANNGAQCASNGTLCASDTFDASGATSSYSHYAKYSSKSSANGGI